MNDNRQDEKVTPENPGWLTIKDTAERLGVHRNTVREWIATGTLKAYRYGERIVRINPADLDAIAEPYSPIDRQVWR